MIYLSLFLEFFKIGLFTFGGAYGAIPLIRECVTSNGWMTDEMFTNILAISESTPGSIMVNTATYIGKLQGGVFGSAVATLGVILPSYIIILLISLFLKKQIKHPKVVAVMSGIKPCLIGVIMATGIYMVFTNVLITENGFSPDHTALIIFSVLALLSVFYRILKKKRFSPILLIILSAILGVLLY